MITNVRAPRYGFTNADLAFLPYFELMAGDKPPDDFESNGSSYSPDVVCGIDIRPAAHFHDYHYSGQLPGTHDEAARYQADQLFRLNLRTCGLRLLAWVYYSRVRLWATVEMCSITRTVARPPSRDVPKLIECPFLPSHIPSPSKFSWIFTASVTASSFRSASSVWMSLNRASCPRRQAGCRQGRAEAGR